MKKFCFLLLMFLPMAGFTQNNGTWSVSTHFQTEHNFIPMMRNDMLLWNSDGVLFQPQFLYTTGLGINYRFDNQLEISSGIRYSRKQEEPNGYYYYGPDFDYALLSYIGTTRHYVEMPLLARYYMLPGKFKLHVESGWVGGYRVGRYLSSDQRNWMMSAQSGVGANLFLNRWQFALGVNYRLQFDLGERNSYYSINPHAFGIEFKTAFSLNN